jgi:hypothetical protein
MTNSVNREAKPLGTKRRTDPEHLTVAYLAIGAINALRAAGDPLNLDAFEGQMGLIASVTGTALLLDSVADWFDERGAHIGVFVYEVAEPFGTTYTTTLLNAGNAGTDPAAILREIMSGCGYDESDIDLAFKDATSNPRTGELSRL